MAQQAQAVQQQKQPEKVSQSISFKDLPAEGQQQLAAKVGIQLGGQSVVPQGQGVVQQQNQGGNQADVIRRMVQSGQANPQMLQMVAQQGLVDSNTAQALLQQMPNVGMSQEMQYQIGRPLSEDKGLLPPERVQELLQVGL